jgi:hypothetical protein
MTDQPEQRDFPVTFLGDFSRKLIVNTFFNLLGRFWSFAAAILLTPFIWGHLTRGEFGVWVLLSVFLESFTLLDFGLGSAFVKFISAYYTHDDYERINKVLFSGLAFYLVQGVLLVGAGLAARGLLFSFFDISGAETAYFYVLVACSLANIGSMFLSVFRGAQRMDRSNAIEMTDEHTQCCWSRCSSRMGLGPLRACAERAVQRGCFSRCVVVVSETHHAMDVPEFSRGSARCSGKCSLTARRSLSAGLEAWSVFGWIS